jgi:hypothetical protein
MNEAGRDHGFVARGGHRMAREEPGSLIDVFVASFSALAAELGIGLPQEPPVALEPVAAPETPKLEARRSFVVVEVAVHDWCPVALRRAGSNQPAEWLDQLPEIVSSAEARHASGTLMQARTVTGGNYERLALEYAREAADAAGDIDPDRAPPDNRPHVVNAGKGAGRCLAAWAVATGQHEDAFKLAAATVERLAAVAD